jgi:hypothetical protein
VIARLIVPRVPRFSLFPFVQLIRPSLSLVTVPTGKGSGTRTEFGDMQLFDLAVLPWPARETGVYMGIGPVFVFPTATDRTAGQSAWQAGPAFGMIYKGIPRSRVLREVGRLHVDEGLARGGRDHASQVAASGADPLVNPNGC